MNDSPRLYVQDGYGIWHSVSWADDGGWWSTTCGKRVFGTAEAVEYSLVPEGEPRCRCGYSVAEVMAFHVVSSHCNIAGIHNSFNDNWDYHHHEHHGPGGIRNHSYDDRYFDEEKIEAVLEEGEMAS